MSKLKDPPDGAILAPVEPFQDRLMLGYCIKGRYGYFPYVGIKRPAEAEWEVWRCNFPRGGYSEPAAALREAIATGKSVIADEFNPDTLYEYPEGGPADLPPRLRRLALTIEDADLTAEHPRYYWSVIEATEQPEVFDIPVEEAAYPGYRTYGEALDAGVDALRRLMADELDQGSSEGSRKGNGKGAGSAKSGKEAKSAKK